MGLPDRAFGIDYARSGNNSSFARVTRPESVALQDFRKRLSTKPKMIFWRADLLATGHMPTICLADLVLSSGVTADDVRDAVREVLMQSPFAERADVLVVSIAPDCVLLATVYLLQGQKLTLDITTNPFSVTSKDVPIQ